MRVSRRSLSVFLIVLLVFSFIIFLFHVGMVYATWLDEDWFYRKSHVIDAASDAGTNYTVLITVFYGSGTDGSYKDSYRNVTVGSVYLNGKCQADFDDVNFTDDDGSTCLYHWNMTFFQGANCTFWVRINDDISSSSATIYVYYGNSAATSGGFRNMEYTFLNYTADDFTGSSLNTTKWTQYNGGGYTGVTGAGNAYINKSTGNVICPIIESVATLSPFNIAVEAKCYWSVLPNTAIEGLNMRSNLASANAYLSYLMSHSGTDYDVYFDAGADGSYDNLNDTGSWSTSTWYQLGLWFKTGKYMWTRDSGSWNITYGSRSYPSTVNQYLMLGCYAEGNSQSRTYNMTVDWVFERKWVDPEPTHGSWGTEQTPETSTYTTGTDLNSDSLQGFILFRDCIKINLTTSEAWETKNLSSYVPSTASGVVLDFHNTFSSTYAVDVRTYGSTDDFYASSNLAPKYHRYAVVALNLSCIQIKSAYQWIWIFLKGYTDQAVTLYTNAQKFEISATYAWNEVNANLPSNATGVICRLVNTALGGATIHTIRCKGSSDNRVATSEARVAEGSWIFAFCGVNRSGIFEQYISAIENDLYVVGYTTYPCIWLTNTTQVTLSQTSTWETPSISSTATFFEIENTNTTWISLAELRNRKSNSDLTGTSGVRNGAHIYALCDNVAVYRNCSQVKLFVVGYVEPMQVTNVGHTSAVRNQTTTTYSYWSSITNLSGYIFGFNNSGHWENDSWTSLSDTSASWINKTFTLNETLGNTVTWQVWTNESTYATWQSTSNRYIYVVRELPDVLKQSFGNSIAIGTEWGNPIYVNGTKEAIYISYLDTATSLWQHKIKAYDMDLKTWTDNYTFYTSPSSTYNDHHYHPSLGLLPNGSLIYIRGYGDCQGFAVSNNSALTQTNLTKIIAEWNAEKSDTIPPSPAYPMPFFDNPTVPTKLIVFSRTGTADNGNTTMWTWNQTIQGFNVKTIVYMTSSETSYYYPAITLGGGNEVLLSYGRVTNNSYFIYTDNFGTSFKNASGTTMSTPFYYKNTSALAMTNLCDTPYYSVTCDANKHLTLMYEVRPDFPHTTGNYFFPNWYTLDLWNGTIGGSGNWINANITDTSMNQLTNVSITSVQIGYSPYYNKTYLWVGRKNGFSKYINAWNQSIFECVYTDAQNENSSYCMEHNGLMIFRNPSIYEIFTVEKLKVIGICEDNDKSGGNNMLLFGRNATGYFLYASEYVAPKNCTISEIRFKVNSTTSCDIHNLLYRCGVYNSSLNLIGYSAYDSFPTSVSATNWTGWTVAMRCLLTYPATIVEGQKYYLATLYSSSTPGAYYGLTYSSGYENQTFMYVNSGTSMPSTLTKQANYSYAVNIAGFEVQACMRGINPSLRCVIAEAHIQGNDYGYFNALWDSVNTLQSADFYWNVTGTMVNNGTVSLSGTYAWANFTRVLPHQNMTIAWYQTCLDGINNETTPTEYINITTIAETYEGIPSMTFSFTSLRSCMLTILSSTPIILTLASQLSWVFAIFTSIGASISLTSLREVFLPLLENSIALTIQETTNYTFVLSLFDSLPISFLFESSTPFASFLNLLGAISIQTSLSTLKQFAFALESTITSTFLFQNTTSFSAFLNLLGSLTMQTSLSSLKHFTFYLENTLPITFLFQSTVPFAQAVNMLNIWGSVAIQTTISSLQHFSFNLQNTVSTTFLFETTRTISALLNLSGSIPTQLALTTIRIINLNILENIPIAFNFNGLTQIIAGLNFLNIFGEIPATFYIQHWTNLTTLTEYATKSFVVALFFITLFIAIPLLVIIIGRRK